ncbi:hypothetical protein ACLEPN_13470 [Myxococcus sp. 1LA]
MESAIDREDLTRLFVQAPAQPMPHLLPPALLDAPARPRPSAPPVSPARTVTLRYDASVEDQRAVAERIQVKLHQRGYTVALEALPRAALRARWAQGDFELMLHALLLPPCPRSRAGGGAGRGRAQGPAGRGAARHRRAPHRRGAGCAGA